MIKRAKGFSLVEGRFAAPATETSSRDFRLDIELPTYRAWTPGQFVMLRWGAHVIGRPFAIVDWKRKSAKSSRLSVWVRRLGAGTEELFQTAEKGGRVWATLPLGRGVASDYLASRGGLVFVSGGVGGASILPLVRARKKNGRDLWIHGEIDAASMDRFLLKDPARPGVLCFEKDLTKARRAVGPRLAKHLVEGRVTKALLDLSFPEKPAALVVCGPSPMLRAVAETAAAHPELAGVPVVLGLEEKMGCGIGLCFSCSVLTREGPERCCLEGPWFEASRLPEHFAFRTEGRNW